MIICQKCDGMGSITHETVIERSEGGEPITERVSLRCKQCGGTGLAR